MWMLGLNTIFLFADIGRLLAQKIENWGIYFVRLKRASLSLAILRSHLKFNQRCKTDKFIPPVLRLKDPIRNSFSKTVLEHTGKKLLEARIKGCFSKISFLSAKVKSLIGIITLHTPSDITTKLIQEITSKINLQNTSTALKHEKKIDHWKKKYHFPGDNHCIVKLSEYELGPSEISLLNKASFPLEFITRHSYTPGPPNHPKKYRSLCFLPYSPSSADIARSLKAYGIRTLYKNSPNLLTSLRHPYTKSHAPPDPLHSVGAVYSVSCEQCSATYVGETGRSVAIRMSEHSRNISNQDTRSLLYQHTLNTGHTFNTNHPTIHYRRIHNQHQRLVLESIESHRHNSINRKIDLPDAYRALLALQLSLSLFAKEILILNNLSKNKNITISRADKGGSVVILNTEDYINRMKTHLNNTEFFIKIEPQEASKSITAFKKSIHQLLKNLIIDQSLKKQILENPGTHPYIYGLPKIHKKNTPLRPIVAYNQSPAYSLSKHLANRRSEITKNIPHIVKNPEDILQKMKNFKLKANHRIVSYDVKDLYTSLPHDLIMGSLQTILIKHKEAYPDHLQS
ncbi:hypothetical protein LAZ67_4003212 [Cordylochernes scorpioides]|uniref:GIY-YIG domain-containing protein n=1 Tax=Cordylochernes scorpioides TaxID=51811 RepID=A0ABY6KDF9_9ARAC|nr:hypothetical protein LAZ67_4003212 [Cordylochernes scorpioides]